MGKAVLLVAFLMVVLAVVGCAPSATPTPVPPTPDAKATETKIAQNIFATQTASVPTATNTPTNTATPISTATPTITNTPVPSSIPTQIVFVPSGWKKVTTISDAFTFFYPPNYKIAEDLGSNITLHQDNSERSLLIGFGGFQLTGDLEKDTNRFVEFTANNLSGLKLTLASKGIWDDGIHKGVYVEYKKKQDFIPYHSFYIALNVSGKTVVIALSRQFEDTDDTAREILAKLTPTIKLGK